MTRGFLKIVSAFLAVNLILSGQNKLMVVTTTLTTSPLPMIGTANTLFDESESGNMAGHGHGHYNNKNKGLESQLPLCSNMSSSEVFSTIWRGRDKMGGGISFYQGGVSSSDVPRRDINGVVSETSGSGNVYSDHGIGNRKNLVDSSDDVADNNFVEFIPLRNESELIYGADMEVVLMLSTEVEVNVEETRTSRNKRSNNDSGGASASNSSGGLTIKDVKYFTYGILWPTICGLGLIGNILNLIVLSQNNMKGAAYIYMKGYSSAALMAITVAIPFANRILRNNEVGPWTNIYQALFHTHLELYLGNSCLGIGVMMLVALTMERFVAVCHPEKSRALQGSNKAYFVIASIPICTFLTYSPHLFLSTLLQCVTVEGVTIYQKRSNQKFIQSAIFPIYKWFLGLVFRLIPTILLAYLNLRIIIAYRRTCARRRIMTGKRSRDERKKFAEESRIMLLLGSTSVLFFVCVTPMVILSVMISDKLLKSFSFQVFRATANLLEVTNYSLTFYIYCLFSREFRNTFLGLLRIGKKKSPLAAGPHGQCTTPTNKPSGGGSNTTGKLSSDPAMVIQQKGKRGEGSAPLLAVVCFLLFL